MASTDHVNMNDLSSDRSAAKEQEWILARKGISLLINNNYEESQALFLQYPNSLVMYAGYSFTIFMDALMSFDEEKLSNAVLILKEVEKRSTAKTGWFKTFSLRMFGSSGTDQECPSIEEQLETQIILADSQVCLAIITFLQQDITGYFKGGWVLRKAWKVYQKTYRDILTLYKQTIGNMPDPLQTSNSPPTTQPEEDFLVPEWDSPENQLNGESTVIDKATIVRLMGAVSFGYGLFQLGVSLLPPSLTRLISILGFSTSRQHGIACLMYARLGVDMRAPLASLALLWYHTIVRPFYAIDGINVQAGVEISNVLIKESENEFAQSSLFLFFAGRASKLKSDIPSALASFQIAKDNASHHEIKVLCLHEIGWCHLIELDYERASEVFTHLKHASRWSRLFYVYLSSICIGAIPDISKYGVFDEIRKASKGIRCTQLDEFLERRFHCCPVNSEAGKKLDAVYFRLLVFEMLYLWNALASCNPINVQKIITDCLTVDSFKDEPMKGLSSLILGACYNIQNDITKAESYFRKCLEQRQNEACNAEDAHISAFAQYELGSILIHNQQSKEEGKCQLQQINRYTHYDFDARLTVRVHSILKQLD